MNTLTKQFFNRGNLSALRELALRRTADRVDAQMEDFRRENSVKTSWPTADRLLVCVGPSPFSEQLVRAARRMAAALRAQWIAAYVETPAAANLPAEARERLTQTLRLAERLGAQTITLNGTNPSEEIVSYARLKNVARIIIGKPDGRRWKERLTGSFVDEVIRKSGPIDVYVIRDETGTPLQKRQPREAKPVAWLGYLWSAIITIGTAALGILLYHHFNIANSNILMIDLLGVVVVALQIRPRPRNSCRRRIRRRIRFHRCPALLLLRRHRSPIPDHLLRDAADRLDHRRVDRSFAEPERLLP